MKLRDLLEMAEKEPELLDYTLNLSQYMRIPGGEDGEFIGEGEDFTCVVDFPIRAILSHEDDKEIRFALYNSDFDAIEESKDRVLKIIEEKRDEMEG